MAIQNFSKFLLWISGWVKYRVYHLMWIRFINRHRSRYFYKWSKVGIVSYHVCSNFSLFLILCIFSIIPSPIMSVFHIYIVHLHSHSPQISLRPSTLHGFCYQKFGTISFWILGQVRFYIYVPPNADPFFSIVINDRVPIDDLESILLFVMFVRNRLFLFTFLIRG